MYSEIIIKRIRDNLNISIREKDIAICYIAWLNSNNKIRFVDLSGELNVMFLWSNTPQGDKFWWDIYLALMD